MSPDRARGLTPWLGAALLALGAVLAGCGGEDVLQYDYTLEQRVQYSLWSPGNSFVAGDRVTFLRGDCGSPCRSTTHIRQIFTATASAGALVAVDFTDEFPDEVSIFVTIYVDKNGNAIMDNGDQVWGADPTNFTGYGAQGMAVYLTLMRDGTFEQPGIGVITYTGPAQPW